MVFRLRAARLAAVVAIGLSCCAQCSKKAVDTAQDSPTTPVTDAFPLAIGSHWEYDIQIYVDLFGRPTESYSRPCTLTVADTTLHHPSGLVAARVVYSPPYASVDGDTISQQLVTVIPGDSTHPCDTVTFYDTDTSMVARSIFVIPADSGDAWPAAGCGMQTVISTSDTISVPAGTFDETQHTRYACQLPTNSTSDWVFYHDWIVPGVGIPYRAIAREQRLSSDRNSWSHTWKLRSYHVAEP